MTPREAVQAALLVAALVVTLVPRKRVAPVLAKVFQPAVTREDLERVTTITPEPGTMNTTPTPDGP